MAIFDPKARVGYQSRAAFDFTVLEAYRGAYWFHTASLGEFEQVKYLITVLRQRVRTPIVVTFFSPSGYEASIRFSSADAIFYLPYDNPSSASRWVQTLRPKAVFWVRYDFWLYYLKAIQHAGIPLILLNGVFWQRYSPIYRPILKVALSTFSHIYTISDTSRLYLDRLGYPSTVLPDTRYDRMKSIADTTFEDSVIDQFASRGTTIVCGSLWPRDLELLIPAIHSFPYIQWILVPHELDMSFDQLTHKHFYSSQTHVPHNMHILVIDTIGILSRIYRLGYICYVGGGFDKVVHSTLEPLAYAKPIFCGPHIQKSEDATQLAQSGMLTPVSNSAQLIAGINSYISDTDLYQAMHSKMRHYFDSRVGSVQRILSRHIDMR